uniref:Immunoglobulin domain-containing protein n=1 Tax=Fundulus heteroclitus TaxID=8078 RepID=A0A3Q2NWK2_FUNHE
SAVFLLCNSLLQCCWISVSVCQFNTVVVRPAEEVTLLCNDIRTFTSHIWWFKMNSSPNISRISSMMNSGSNALLRDGFNFSKYTVTSNTTKMFLKIKDVNFSDSGLYFCGENKEGTPTVCLLVFCLYVLDGLPELSCMILGCIAVFLTVVIIALANLNPDSQSYAAMNFRSNVRSNRRSADERVLETNVVYAATG